MFVLARVVPGDPCRAVLGERATDAVCDAFITRYGLDKAIIPGLFKANHAVAFHIEQIPTTLLDNQFVAYLGQLAQGDLGTSIKHSRPVTTLLIERLPTTVELTIMAMLFAVSVGIPLGLISGYRHNSKADVGTMVVANFGVSIPVFVLGLALAFVFGLVDFVSGLYIPAGIISGQFNVSIDAFRHLILPAIALGTIPLAIIARITRSSLLEVLGQDFVRTARAKGVKERSVILRHATRNALLPVVTVIGLQLGALLSGAVLTESVFNLAGVGRTMFEAITGRDYVVVQGLTLIIALIYVTVNLVVDISYGFLDPRVRAR